MFVLQDLKTIAVDGVAVKLQIVSWLLYCMTKFLVGSALKLIPILFGGSCCFDMPLFSGTPLERSASGRFEKTRAILARMLRHFWLDDGAPVTDFLAANVLFLEPSPIPIIVGHAPFSLLSAWPIA